MSKVAIVCAEEQRKRYSDFLLLLEKFWNEKGYFPFYVFIKTCDRTVDIIDKIRNEDVIYIISLDMAGFEMKTLLEDAMYNIVTAKQLHIVIDGRVLEQFCRTEFALNLYLCLSEEEYRRKKIPAINLLKYSRFETNEKGYIVNIKDNYEELERVCDCFIKDVEG